jgi:hypothetical protein
MADVETSKLQDYEITGCHIRSKDIISFVGQKTDGQKPYETRIFFYYPDDPIDDRWGFAHLGEAHRVFGCGCSVPKDRWVFLNSEGGVYVVGGGDNSFEKPLPITERATMTRVRCLSDGKAYAVSSMRNVFRRDEQSQWTDLSVPIQESEESIINSIGFDAIDAFSETDIYACGSDCDMWRYDGKTWRKIPLPSNSLVSDMVCAGDGFVYVACWDGKVIKGRNDQWKIIQQDDISQLDAIAWFNGAVYISTWNRLYQLQESTLKPVTFENGYKQAFCGFLAAGHGLLISAGPKEAHIFDGNQWEQIFSFR